MRGMTHVQAKVRCIANTPPQWAMENDTMRIARFTPVHDSDPAHPNFEWSEATPSGYLELTITNRAAFERFEVNKEYMVTFAPES